MGPWQVHTSTWSLGYQKPRHSSKPTKNPWTLGPGTIQFYTFNRAQVQTPILLYTIYITPSFDTVDSSSEVEMKHPLQLGTSKMHFFLSSAKHATRLIPFDGDSQEICRPRSINLWLYNYFKVLKTSKLQCFWGPQRFLFLSLIFQKYYRILSLCRTTLDRNQPRKDRPGAI